MKSYFLKPQFYKSYIRPILFSLPPEFSQKIAYMVLEKRIFQKLISDNLLVNNPKLTTKFVGIELNNPVGLAAGYDKNCKHITATEKLGFSYLVCGTIINNPRYGNPKPRISRLPKDNALINSLGFPSEGLNQIIHNLNKSKNHNNPIILSISGLNINEILNCYKKLETYANAFEINISSPNTKGLKLFQDHKILKELFIKLNEIRTKPIIIKIPPYTNSKKDVYKSVNYHDKNQIMKIVQTCLEQSIDGITVSNTTPITSNKLQSKSGGLSGKPIFENMIEMIRDIKYEVGQKIDISACGGISTGKDVLEAIKAGAKATQIYTSLIYEGPGIVKIINEEILSLLKENEDLMSLQSK